ISTRRAAAAGFRGDAPGVRGSNTVQAAGGARARAVPGGENCRNPNKSERVSSVSRAWSALTLARRRNQDADEQTNDQTCASRRLRLGGRRGCEHRAGPGLEDVLHGDAPGGVRDRLGCVLPGGGAAHGGGAREAAAPPGSGVRGGG